MTRSLRKKRERQQHTEQCDYARNIRRRLRESRGKLVREGAMKNCIVVNQQYDGKDACGDDKDPCEDMKTSSGVKKTDDHVEDKQVFQQMRINVVESIGFIQGKKKSETTPDDE